MTITIKRNTGFAGSLTPIAVKINEKKAAEVHHRQEIEINIPDEEARLSVSQLGGKSPEIKVKDGDIIEVTTSKWSQAIFYFSLAFIFLSPFLVSPFIQTFTTRVFVLVLLFLLFVVSYWFVDNFEVKVLGNNREEKY